MSFSFKKFLSTLAVKKDGDTGELAGAAESSQGGRSGADTEKGIDILTDCDYTNLETHASYHDPENIVESPQKLRPTGNTMPDVNDEARESSDEDIAIPENLKHILSKIEQIKLTDQSPTPESTKTENVLLNGSSEEIGRKMMKDYERTMEIIKASLDAAEAAQADSPPGLGLLDYNPVMQPSGHEEGFGEQAPVYMSCHAPMEPYIDHKVIDTPDIPEHLLEAVVEEAACAKKSEKEEVDNKVWREGMPEQAVVVNDPTKTLFMSQNFNKTYEEADKKFKGPSYEKAIQKLSREVNYFNRILIQVDEDVKNTEYRVKNPNKVVVERSRMKAELNALREKINLFVDDVLSGDIRTEAPPAVEKVIGEVAESTQMEYVFPYDKKINKDVEGCQLVNKCSDCGVQIVHSSRMSLEEAMQEHAKTAEHRAVVPEKIQRKAADMPAAMSPFGSSQPQPKKPSPTQDEVKTEKLMSLHRVVVCLMDDTLLNCLPCGINFPQDQLATHCNEEGHCSNLNTYYCRQQKELVAQNPDTFGFNKSYYVSDAHIVVHKLYVNPFEKYAYCGICNKELPCSMKPIDGHITSKNHDRLLKEALEKKEGGITVVNGKLVSADDKPEAEVDLLDNNGQTLDVAALEAFLEGKQKQTENKTDSTNMESSPERKAAKPERTMLDKALYKALGMSYGIVSKPDGKFDCTICDVKRMSNVSQASGHAYSTVHRANCKNKLKLMSPEQQEQLLNTTNPYLLTTIMSNDAQAQPQAKPQAESRRAIKIITHRSIPNAFYCIVCRITINNASDAFEHTRIANHTHYQIDSVAGSLSNTFYKCEKCNVKISGEKNAVGHIIGVKHKAEGKSTTASAKINIPEKSRAKKNENLPNSWRNEAKFIPTNPEEVALFERNGIVPKSSDSFVCNYCCAGLKDREQMYEHMFSYQHSNALATIKN